MTKRVLLTGITGYIGQHCGAELLRQGYHVVGTMRSQSKAEATKLALGAVTPIDNLTIVEADLTKDAGWDEAVKGCDYVLHVASPFIVGEPEDENDLITPAVEGTKRVIAASIKAGVKRMVLTSSVISIIAGKGSGTYNTNDWSDTSADIGAYAKSKTMAEIAAWDAVKGSQMELVVINPGGVFGPSLGADDGQSVKMMTDMVNGKMPMLPDLAIGMVDVRDVATLHVKAITADGVNGKRFIAATAEPVHMVKAAQILKDAGYKVSTRQAPMFLLKVISLFDSEVKGLLPLIGKKISLDNSATIEQLDWEPIPVKDSILDMAEGIRG